MFCKCLNFQVFSPFPLTLRNFQRSNFCKWQGRSHHCKIVLPQGNLPWELCVSCKFMTFIAVSSLQVLEFVKVDVCDYFWSTQNLSKILHMKQYRENLIISLNINDLMQLLRAAPWSSRTTTLFLNRISKIPGSLPFFFCLSIVPFTLSKCGFQGHSIA